MKHESLVFVHAADLHLDSPFKGIGEASGPVASALRRSTFEAYRALVFLCLEVQADFLVVAGDVYDGCDRSLYAQLAFRDGLARLDREGVAAYVVHGNHDPMSGWASHLAWPSRVHVFGRDVATVPFERDGRVVAEIAGISHDRPGEKRNLSRLFPRERRSARPFRVAMLHCNVGGAPGHDDYAPCTLEDLQGADVDYWALGHVHQHQVVARHPHVVYSGNTQGRSIREAAPRGCYVVRVEGGGVADVGFRALDAVRWAHGIVAIDGLDTVDGLDTRITACVEEMRAGAEGRPVVARLAIRGRGPLNAELRRDGVLAGLRQRCREAWAPREPFTWIEQIECSSGDDLALDALGRRQDLVGAVVQVARELEQDADGLRRLIADLYERKTRLVDPPTPEELRTVLADARALCIDLLEGRS